jgi:transposase
MITIGIDPHKSSVTAVALDHRGARLAEIRLPVTAELGRRLVGFASDWTDRQWAVEGASGLGLGVAQKPRRGRRDGARRAGGAGVACSVAGHRQRPQDRRVGCRFRRRRRATQHRPARRPRRRRHRVAAAVVDHRDDLVSERTRALNRLHRLLRELVPGGAKRQLSIAQAADLLRGVRPLTAADTYRKQLARDLHDSMRRLDTRIRALTEQISELIEDNGTKLTQIRGVGPVVAAKIIGHTGDIGRFPSRDHYASYTGTAPLDASSGEQNRHRLSRLGNRQLNAALHVIAVCQASRPGPGQDLYRRKLAERKTPNEARRSLKRRLSDVIYRQLLQDQEAAKSTGT